MTMRVKPFMSIWTARIAAPAAMLLLLGGCFGPGPAATASPEEAAPREEAAPLAPHETWDICRMQGARVGYGHTTIRYATDGDRRVLKIEGLIHFAVQRFGQTTEQDIRFTDTETPAGGLIAFDCEIRQGTTPLRTTGRVVGDRLDVEMTTEGAKRATSMPWSADCGGMSAPEESLLRRPMEPGEHRVVRHLTIDNQLADMEMTARQEESVQLLAGTFRLLRIETLERMPGGQKIKGVSWIDRTGETVKSWIEPMNMEVFRVPKEVALAKTDLAKFDFGERTLVRVDRPVPGGHQSKRVRYRVHLEGGDPSEVFVSGPSQQVKKIDAHTAEVTVYAIRPCTPGGNPEARDDPPTDADRRPNNFIQSDDAVIVSDAREAAGRETDPWRVAVALEQYVHKAITQKDFTQAFATAAEVARSHEGDCTEHAVFLAALARARGIPARVAVGLVYMSHSATFGYHMWTEVYVDRRWIPIDATLAQGGIGGGHLKLAQTSLEGISAYSSFLPVVQVIGRLRVEVLDAD